MGIDETFAIDEGLITNFRIREISAMEGCFHVVDISAKIIKLSGVRALGVMHVERNSFNGGIPWAAVWAFVFFENVASGDEIRIGGEITQAFDIDPFAVPLDLFHHNVNAAIVIHRDGPAVGIEEDFHVAGANASKIPLGLSCGFVNDGVSHQGLVGIRSVENPV